MFKITSFEEHLQIDGDGSIRCHFDTINLNQSDFGITYSFKILVSEGKNKKNLKNRESQKKKKKIQFSCTVYVIFYSEIWWFYQDLKNENLSFLNLYSVHTAKIQDLSLEIMLIPPKGRVKDLYNSKGFSFILEQVSYFYFLKAKFIKFFKMC